jgi:hypothetical protein
MRARSNNPMESVGLAYPTVLTLAGFFVSQYLGPWLAVTVTSPLLRPCCWPLQKLPARLLINSRPAGAEYIRRVRTHHTDRSIERPTLVRRRSPHVLNLLLLLLHVPTPRTT